MLLGHRAGTATLDGGVDPTFLEAEKKFTWQRGAAGLPRAGLRAGRGNGISDKGSSVVRGALLGVRVQAGRSRHVFRVKPQAALLHKELGLGLRLGSALVCRGVPWASVPCGTGRSHGNEAGGNTRGIWIAQHGSDVPPPRGQPAAPKGTRPPQGKASFVRLFTGPKESTEDSQPKGHLREGRGAMGSPQPLLLLLGHSKGPRDV